MTWDELLAAAERIRATALAANPAVAWLQLAGIGWATVEGERAMRELDAVLPGTASDDLGWVETSRDEVLGARAWMRVCGAGDPAAIVVLEPDTEGLLAAALARRGEGVAAIYLGRPATETTVERGGPLGPGRLLRGGPAWGPHAIVLREEPAGGAAEGVAGAGGPR
jgi:hypothetical protein